MSSETVDMVMGLGILALTLITIVLVCFIYCHYNNKDHQRIEGVIHRMLDLAEQGVLTEADVDNAKKALGLENKED